MVFERRKQYVNSIIRCIADELGNLILLVFVLVSSFDLFISKVFTGRLRGDFCCSSALRLIFALCFESFRASLHVLHASQQMEFFEVL